MLKYIVVREFTDPDKEPRVIGQFSERDKAEQFALHSVGICWIYEISDKVWEWENKGAAPPRG